MYGQHFQLISIDQPGMTSNPGRGPLHKKANKLLFPFVPEHLVSRDGRVRPSRPPASACSFSTLRLNLVLTHGVPPGFHDRVYKINVDVP